METELDNAPELDTEQGLENPTQHEGEDRETLREALSKSYDAASVEDAKITREPGEPPEAGAAPPADPTPPQAGAAPELDELSILNEARPIPERLKTKLGASWATLDPVVKAEFHNYESHIGALANKFGKNAKAWEETQSIVAPYEQMIRSEGGNFHTAVASLFQTAHILRNGTPEQKRGLVDRMCEVYRVPAATPADPNAPQPLRIPPEYDQRLAALEQERLTARAEEEQNLQNRITSDIESFTSDPKNIYVKEPGFLGTMAGLIKAGKAKDLPDAYTQAAWLHDGPRAVEIAKLNAARVQSQSARVQKARRGAGVNGNAPGNVKLDASKMTLRQTLEAAYDGELDS